MNKLVIPVLVLILFLGSCGNDVVFRQHNKMENITWNRFDVQQFDVPVEAGDLLDFYISVRHHTDFPYDKLWVNITFYTPDGSTRSRDYDFDLKDSEGEWLADGMGELWDIDLLVRKELPFNKKGNCRVRIENKYPKYDTPGIIEIGLLVKRSKR